MSATVWYWLTFGFVLFVMAIFVTKKFNEIVFVLDDDLGPLLSGMSVSSISTRSRWLQGFATYFITYAFVFVGLCICQPLAAWTFKTATGVSPGETWASPAGPLVVAALLIGVIPNLPLVDYVERSIRRVAQRVAGIPEELFDNIDDVKSVEALNRLGSGVDPQMARKIRRFELVGSLLNVASTDTGLATASHIHYNTLGPWVYSETARSIWSNRILSRLNVPRTKVAVAAKQYAIDLDIILRDWERHLEPAVNQALDALQLSFDLLIDTPEKLNETAVQEAVSEFAQRNDEAVTDFKARWLVHAQNVSKLSYQCDALFSLMAYSNEYLSSARAPDVIKDVVSALQRQSLARLLNSIIFASVTAFFSSMILIGLFRLLKSYFREEAPVQGLFLQSINLAWNNALTLLFLFTVPVFVTVIIRYWSQHRTSRSLFDQEENLPYLKLAGIGGATFLLSGCLLNIYYLASQLMMVRGENAVDQITKIFHDFFSVVAVQQLALAIVGALLALAVCYIFDKRLFEKENSGRINFFSMISRSLFSLCATVMFIVVFVALQSNFHSEGYFTPQTIGGTQVRMYDNLISDCVSIAVFLLAFLWGLLAAVRKLKPYRKVDVQPPPRALAGVAAAAE